jgi:predicted AAA+ superfamily ATPase
VIDEAQLAPPLFAALRVAIDRDRQRKGRFLLSGSSSPELVKQISESLAGRIARVELGPLSLSEAWQLPPSPLYALLGAGAPAADIYGAAQGRLTAPQLRDYWFAGGYPPACHCGPRPAIHGSRGTGSRIRSGMTSPWSGMTSP